jgi:hypothetical protein
MFVDIYAQSKLSSGVKLLYTGLKYHTSISIRHLPLSRGVLEKNSGDNKNINEVSEKHI